MRMFLAALALLLVPAAPAGAAAPFRATLRAPTHAPKVNARWRYEVRVTDRTGRPLAARITVQLIDPFGGVHPVEFDCCKRNIVRHLIRGVFRDAVEFPTESRGFKLTFRVIVTRAGRKVVLTYWVKPR